MRDAARRRVRKKLDNDVLGILKNLSLNLIRSFGIVWEKIKSMPKQVLYLLLDPSEALRLLTKA